MARSSRDSESGTIAKRSEIRSDSLVRVVMDARDEDLHDRRHRLLFGTHLQHFDTSKAASGGYPAEMEFGREGPLWVVDRGKPTERHRGARSARLHRHLWTRGLENPQPLNTRSQDTNSRFTVQ